MKTKSNPNPIPRICLNPLKTGGKHWIKYMVLLIRSETEKSVIFIYNLLCCRYLGILVNRKRIYQSMKPRPKKRTKSEGILEEYLLGWAWTTKNPQRLGPCDDELTIVGRILLIFSSPFNQFWLFLWNCPPITCNLFSQKDLHVDREKRKNG